MTQSTQAFDPNTVCILPIQVQANVYHNVVFTVG